jgi:hypothetical protein
LCADGFGGATTAVTGCTKNISHSGCIAVIIDGAVRNSCRFCDRSPFINHAAVGSLLTNAVKRFDGRIRDLAQRSGKAAGAQALGVPEQLAYRENMAHRKPVTRQPRKRRKKAKPLKAPERSGFFPVVTSTLLSMICTTTVFATVLAVLLGIAKWT